MQPISTTTVPTYSCNIASRQRSRREAADGDIYQPTATREQAPMSRAALMQAVRETTLPMVGSSIGEVETLPALALPAGYEASLASRQETRSESLNGQTVTLTQDVNIVRLKGPGKDFDCALGNGWADMQEFRDRWVDEVALAQGNPDFQPEWTSALNWGQYTNTPQGVGSAGNLVSLYQVESTYSGGAHPNNEYKTRTYNPQGQVVQLDQLLSQQQLDSVVQQVQSGLKDLPVTNGITAEFFHFGDLRQAVNENFSLKTNPQGKVQLEVDLPSGSHALGPMMAKFQFEAPNDASFRQKIGADN